MRTTITLISTLVILFFASSAVIMKGCGKSLNGGSCGGCPDSTAPLGSTVVLSPATLTAGSACYVQAFQFLDSSGQPLSDICVEIFTNGNIALHTSGDCSSTVTASPASYIRTRTNSSGVVMVDLAASCTGQTTGTTSVTTFVTAQSCGVEGTASVSVAVSGGCP